MKFDGKKFLSRKFLVALALIVAGIAVACGADASDIHKIIGYIVSGVSGLAYIFSEAMVDTASVSHPSNEQAASKTDEEEP